MTGFKEIWRCDDSWWQLRGREIELADNYVREALDHVFPPGGDQAYLADCEEAFASTVVDAGEHTRIHPGDICVSDGIGSDKIFLRPIGE